MSDAAAPLIEVRRAGDRFVTRAEGIETWHSFSFGGHHDASNLSFGPMLAHNDERLAAGAGYPDHIHRDTEIVTWVLFGALEHRDDTGRTVVVHPGQVQVMSAGSGIVHSERNAEQAPTRFVQVWLTPDVRATWPKYQVRDAGVGSGDFNKMVTVASGRDRPAHTHVARLGTGRAALSVARLGRGESISVPNAPFIHVFVARGSINSESAGPLESGDVLRISGVFAVEAGTVTATEAAELLIWTMS